MGLFTKATKEQARLRMALIGLSGGGKTYTALKIATGLSDRVAVIDTERGSASKYSDIFDFDRLELESFEPEKYMQAIKAAEEEGYGAVIIDSLSHAWNGTGGLLERHDNIKLKSGSQNSYMAWGQITPVHTRLIDTMLQTKMHLIVTMRTKTEYVIENINGKQVPRKIGTQPIQRDGMEYEFDCVGDMDIDHNLIVGKTRITGTDGKVYNKPGDELVDTLKAWLSTGAPMITIAQGNEISAMADYKVIPDKYAYTVQKEYLDKLTQARADELIAWLKSLPMKEQAA